MVVSEIFWLTLIIAILLPEYCLLLLQEAFTMWNFCISGFGYDWEVLLLVVVALAGITVLIRFLMLDEATAKIWAEHLEAIEKFENDYEGEQFFTVPSQVKNLESGTEIPQEVPEKTIERPCITEAPIITLDLTASKTPNLTKDCIAILPNPIHNFIASTENVVVDRIEAAASTEISSVFAVESIKPPVGCGRLPESSLKECVETASAGHFEGSHQSYFSTVFWKEASKWSDVGAYGSDQFSERSSNSIIIEPINNSRGERERNSPTGNPALARFLEVMQRVSNGVRENGETLRVWMAEEGERWFNARDFDFHILIVTFQGIGRFMWQRLRVERGYLFLKFSGQRAVRNIKVGTRKVLREGLQCCCCGCKSSSSKGTKSPCTQNVALERASMSRLSTDNSIRRVVTRCKLLYQKFRSFGRKIKDKRSGRATGSPQAIVVANNLKESPQRVKKFSRPGKVLPLNQRRIAYIDTGLDGNAKLSRRKRVVASIKRCISC